MFMWEIIENDGHTRVLKGVFPEFAGSLKALVASFCETGVGFPSLMNHTDMGLQLLMLREPLETTSPRTSVWPGRLNFLRKSATSLGAN